MEFTKTSCISAANLQFCPQWFVAASSWSVKKLAKNYENTSRTVCPYLPSKLLHEYAQEFCTVHGRVSTLVHFFKKTNGREKSASLSKSARHKKHARAGKCLCSDWSFRLPKMQATTSERVLRPEGGRSDDRATPSADTIGVGDTQTECESGAVVELHVLRSTAHISAI
jgi:hypothetical protein